MVSEQSRERQTSIQQLPQELMLLLLSPIQISRNFSLSFPKLSKNVCNVVSLCTIPSTYILYTILDRWNRISFCMLLCMSFQKRNERENIFVLMHVFERTTVEYRLGGWLGHSLHRKNVSKEIQRNFNWKCGKKRKDEDKIEKGWNWMSIKRGDIVLFY